MSLFYCNACDNVFDSDLNVCVEMAGALFCEACAEAAKPHFTEEERVQAWGIMRRSRQAAYADPKDGTTERLDLAREEPMTDPVSPELKEEQMASSASLPAHVASATETVSGAPSAAWRGSRSDMATYDAMTGEQVSFIYLPEGSRIAVGGGGDPVAQAAAIIDAHNETVVEAGGEAHTIATLLDALREADKALAVIRMNVMVEVIGGNAKFEGVPEILANDIANVRAAIAAAGGRS